MFAIRARIRPRVAKPFVPSVGHYSDNNSDAGGHRFGHLSLEGGQATQFEPPLMDSWVQLKVVDDDCRLLESNHRMSTSIAAATCQAKTTLVRPMARERDGFRTTI